MKKAFGTLNPFEVSNNFVLNSFLLKTIVLIFYHYYYLCLSVTKNSVLKNARIFLILTLKTNELKWNSWKKKKNFFGHFWRKLGKTLALKSFKCSISSYICLKFKLLFALKGTSHVKYEKTLLIMNVSIPFFWPNLAQILLQDPTHFDFFSGF